MGGKYYLEKFVLRKVFLGLFIIILFVCPFLQIDILVQGSLVEVGSIDEPCQGMNPAYQKIHADGDYVYALVKGVNMDHGILEIVNVSDHTNPFVQSTLDLPYNNGHNLWYSNGYIYTAHRFGGLNMVNVSDPDNPVVVDSVSSSYGQLRGLRSVGNYLYFSDGTGSGYLRIYNISSGALIEVGNYFSSEDAAELVTTSDGNFVYQHRTNGKHDIKIYDVQDKTNLTQVNSFYSHSPSEMQGWLSMAISSDDKYLYVGSSIGLQIFNITDPISPSPIKSINTTQLGHGIFQITLDDDNQVLYVSTGEGGLLYPTYDLVAIDVSIPINANILYKLENVSVEDIDVEGDYLYATNATKKMIVYQIEEEISADAGPNQRVDEDTLVTFAGSGSKGNITNYTWTLMDVTPKTLYGMNTTYIFTTPGIYVVTLNVTDAKGKWDTDEVVITVLDITPPVADAGPDQAVNEDDMVLLNGNGSYDNVGIISYNWTIIDGPNTIHVQNTSTTWVFSKPGLYVAILEVKDSAGFISSDKANITVRDITSPIADAGSFNITNENLPVSLDGSASYDNVGIVSYAWDMDNRDGLDWENPDHTGSNPIHVYPIPGFYIITLNVTDAEGYWDLSTVTIIVLDTTPPIADGGPDQTINEDEIVIFDGNGSYDNVGIVYYNWTIVDGPNTIILRGMSPTYVFSEPGLYVATLEVEDARGLSSMDMVNITVLDITPPKVLHSSPMDSSMDVSIYVSIDILFSEPMNTSSVENATLLTGGAFITSYKWDSTNTTVSIILNGITYKSSYQLIITSSATDLSGNPMPLWGLEFTTMEVEEKEEEDFFEDFLWIILLVVVIILIMIIILLMVSKKSRGEVEFSLKSKVSKDIIKEEEK